MSAVFFENSVLGGNEEKIIEKQSPAFIQRIFLKTKISQFVSFYMAFSGLGIGIVEREISSVHGIDGAKLTRIILLSLNILTTICLLLSIFFLHTNTVKLWRA